MTATILYASAVEERAFSLPLRLALASSDTLGALLEGAWWPRSRDLAAELPALTAVLDPFGRRQLGPAGDSAADGSGIP
ncbi:MULTISPECIES: DUF5994 family protein [Streptomyces]|uniref:DUF5994 family protein n=1 Tax=Streptomyces TaxID=1883 RepID=UPI0027DBC986|nr:DUF5994 family protein [Streptomyces triculaminicus]